VSTQGAKKRVVVVGAGLCGSLVSVLLRDEFQVTLIEQGRKKHPLYSDIDCAEGEVNTSINRAEGLGGTTNYWHNALIELDDADLRKAGIRSGSLEPYYSQAWRFFLAEDELEACNRVRDANRASVEKGGCKVAHMVLPRNRINMWHYANERHPGADIQIVEGKAERIVAGKDGAACHVVVRGRSGPVEVEADYVLVCAGGLATPVLLSRSAGEESGSCMGYHDHPMAYVAKVRLRSDSRLKAVSCTTTETAEVRAGLVYESGGVKTVVYLRPALNLKLKAIQGPARYILSDLRNDPFSPKKIFQLLTNIEAVREAVLFKSKAGFRGDYYSVLLLGEQTPLPTRGLTLAEGRKPSLNWHVTDDERRAYAASFQSFLEEFSADILEKREVPTAEWEFRTAAHHSGAANRFLSDPGELSLDFFSAKGLPNTFVCDGSLLRAAGIANSGLTLVALVHRLVELVNTAATTAAAAAATAGTRAAASA
jgi:choline dehydrogenase-like flavoprotein